MIINVPVNFDTDAMETMVARDVYKMMDKHIAELIKVALEAEPNCSYYINGHVYPDTSNFKELKSVINTVVRHETVDYLKSNENEILNRVADEIATRILRSSKKKDAVVEKLLQR